MILMFNKLPVFILIFAFSAIAVFGFLAMNDGHSHSGCLAATASGGKCPVENAVAGGFHNKVFKSFLLDTLSESFRPSFFRHRNMDLRLAPAPRKVFHWSKIHQNSPNVF